MLMLDLYLLIAALVVVPLVIGFLHYRDYKTFGKMFWPWDKR